MFIEAIALAKQNEIQNLPRLAAIIVKKRQILGIGFNQRRSHPLMFRFSKSPVKIALHAEIAAIVSALRNHNEEELKGAEIYIARVLKDGSTAAAKPCIVCQSALDAYGIQAHWTE